MIKSDNITDSYFMRVKQSLNLSLTYLRGLEVAELKQKICLQ